MGKTAQIRARADADTKRRAEEILDELGLNPSTAINMFYRQIVLRGGLPFSPELPNAETRAANEQARSGEGVTGAAWLPDPDVPAGAAGIAELQAFVASLPIRDARAPDEIIGYDDHGLPS